MADVDARAAGSETPTPRPAAAPLGEAPRVDSGSFLFALSMLVGASGNLLHDIVMGAYTRWRNDLPGVLQRPWQGSNLRHTVEESSRARPAGAVESVKAREIGVSGAWSCAE